MMMMMIMTMMTIHVCVYADEGAIKFTNTNAKTDGLIDRQRDRVDTHKKMCVCVEEKGRGTHEKK